MELDYDPALRLKEERHYTDLGVLQHKITYTYDDAGNRTSKRIVEPGINIDDTYTENIDPTSGYKLDSVTATNNDNSTFAYDAGGRLITIPRDFQGASDTQTLNYNAAGQVTEVLDVGGTNVDYSYEYDALGRRTKESHGSAETNYLIAPAAQRLGAGALDVELQHLATDGNSDLRAGWIFAGENPIIRFHGTEGSETIEYYLEDGIDSVAALIDDPAAGPVSKVAEYRYDGFGNNLDDLYPNPGEGTSSIPNLDGDFGFHAAWRDTETGLYHVRARTYDPETGRFTSPDPATPNEQVPETYHPYSFANNNPHLFSDPTGLFSTVEISVSNSIQTSLSSIQSIAVQQARNFISDQITEFATNSLVKLIGHLVPGFGNVDFDALDDLEAGGLSSRLGTMFQDFVSDTVCGAIGGSIGVADYLWFEPIVERNGNVAKSGLNCGNLHTIHSYLASLKSNERFTPRPDYIINPGDPADGGTWLIGDMTLSGNGLYRKYVDPGKQQGQWRAITNHANEYGTRVSMFITFHRGSKTTFDAISAKLAASGLKSGTLIYVLSLSNRR